MRSAWVAAGEACSASPRILLGIIPGGGATQRLPRLVGPSRAKDLVYTGRQVRADEALSIGLVDCAVAPGLASRSTRPSSLRGRVRPPVPSLALAAAKRVMDEGATRPLAEAVELERSAFVSVCDTEDARAGVSSFLEHRPRPRFRFAGR